MDGTRDEALTDVVVTEAADDIIYQVRPTMPCVCTVACHRIMCAV